LTARPGCSIRSGVNKWLLLIPFVRRQQVLLERAMVMIQNEHCDSREKIEADLNNDRYWEKPSTRTFCKPEEGWEKFPLA
jgi:hypothetical protein